MALGCDFFAPIRFAKDQSGTVLVRRRLLLFSSYLRDFVVHRNFLGLSFLCHVNMPQKMVDPPVDCALALLPIPPPYCTEGLQEAFLE